jgi:predicted signal transduction protein with EAL and GGDEF domain
MMDSLRADICSLPFRVGKAELYVTVSIGVAWMNSTHETPDDLIRRADAALYEAKAAGRNRVVCSASNPDASMTEVTGSRRYLQEFIDRVKRESNKRSTETESK